MKLNESLLAWSVENTATIALRSSEERVHPAFKENNYENLKDKRERLQKYFNDLFKYYSTTIWNIEPLLRFMDDIPSRSIVSQLHIRAISKQVVGFFKIFMRMQLFTLLFTVRRPSAEIIGL